MLGLSNCIIKLVAILKHFFRRRSNWSDYAGFFRRVHATTTDPGHAGNLCSEPLCISNPISCSDNECPKDHHKRDEGKHRVNVMKRHNYDVVISRNQQTLLITLQGWWSLVAQLRLRGLDIWMGTFLHRLKLYHKSLLTDKFADGYVEVIFDKPILLLLFHFSLGIKFTQISLTMSQF